MRALKGGVNGQHQGGRFLESELFTEAPSEPPRLQNCRPLSLMVRRSRMKRQGAMLRSELELELLLFACGPFRSSSRPLFVLVRVALHYMAASKPT